MKRISYLFMFCLFVLAILISACSQVSGSTSGSSTQSLTQAGQLLVGTLKLEGTKNAVDAKEAASLLPLWQAYRQLTTSNTTAEAEMTAVVAQIQSTMTSDQIQAIKALNLNQQDLSSAINSLGVIDSGAGSSSGSSTTSSSSINNTNAGVFNGAGGPQGGGATPAAGGDPLSGSVLGTGTSSSSSTQTSTQQASTVSTNGISPSLLTALIDLLQNRAGILAV